jgi:lysozyme
MRPLPQRTSRKGRAFLIREEGVRRYAYNDPAGHATFGVGHLIHKGPVTDADRIRWGSPSNPKSMRFVDRVLRRDLRKYERAVRGAVRRRIYQYRFDAAVSLCFNIGTGGFERSTVARELRRREPGFVRRAADAFLLWDQPRILLPRRRRERDLFLDGRY